MFLWRMFPLVPKTAPAQTAAGYSLYALILSGPRACQLWRHLGKTAWGENQRRVVHAVGLQRTVPCGCAHLSWQGGPGRVVEGSASAGIECAVAGTEPFTVATMGYGLRIQLAEVKRPDKTFALRVWRSLDAHYDPAGQASRGIMSFLGFAGLGADLTRNGLMMSGFDFDF